MTEKILKPINKKQKDFLESQKRFILFSGGVGAGKSYVGCMKGFLLNCKYPGSRGLICRKEARSLSGSTIKTLLEKIIPPGFIVSYNRMEGVLEHKTFYPGKTSTIVFSGLDKKADQSYPTKIGSTEYSWIFVDEGIELQEGDWQVLATRLRHASKYFNEEQNKKIPKQMFTATNPDSPEHWMYKFFFASDSEDRQVILTNPYENHTLADDYFKNLTETLTGISRERLLHGKWVSAEGMIYKSFDQRVHVVDDDQLLPLADYKEIIFGADSNYPIPRACIVAGVRGDGSVDIIAEFYKDFCQVEQLKDWLAEYGETNKVFLRGWHDPSDPSAIDKLNNTQFFATYKADNKVLPGIASVSRYFDKNLIRIHKSCVNLIKEIQMYAWDREKVGEKPKKTADHAVDALRYCLYSYEQNSGAYTFLEDKEGAFF